MKRETEDVSNGGAMTTESRNQSLPQSKRLCVQNGNGFSGIFRSFNFWSSNGNNSNSNEVATLACQDAEVPSSITRDVYDDRVR